VDQCVLDALVGEVFQSAVFNPDFTVVRGHEPLKIPDGISFIILGSNFDRFKGWINTLGFQSATWMGLASESDILINSIKGTPNFNLWPKSGSQSANGKQLAARRRTCG
jgi:hypothetical protein